MLQYMLFAEKVDTIKKRTCNKSEKNGSPNEGSLAAEALMRGPSPGPSDGDQ